MVLQSETYGSIDELLGRYVAPMNDFVEELTNHRKFLDLPEDEVDDKLAEQKKANPSSIPYSLCWMEMHPGYASLRFVLSKTARHHPVGISPKGFNWGSQCYSNLEKLLYDFKKNPRGVSAKSNKPAPPKPAPPSGAPRASRWGDRAAQPPPPAAGGWSQPPPPQLPPAPPQPVAAWGAAQASYGSLAPPPPRPPPPSLPPPPRMQPPPPPRPPPPSMQPPPQYGGPPPPGPPPPMFNRPPPRPPQYPPPPPGGPPLYQ